MALNKMMVSSESLKNKQIHSAAAALEKLATYQIPPDLIQEGNFIATLEYIVNRTAKFPSVCRAAYNLSKKLKKDLHYQKLSSSDEQSHAQQEADSEKEIMELLTNLGDIIILMTADTPVTQDQSNPSKSKPNHLDLDKSNPGRTFYANGKSLHPYDSCTIKKTLEMSQEHLFPVHPSLSHNLKTSKVASSRDKSLSSECSSRHSNQSVLFSNELVNSGQKNQNHVLKENHSFVKSEDVSHPPSVIPQNYSAVDSISSNEEWIKKKKISETASKESSLLHRGQQSSWSKCNAISFADVFSGPTKPSSGLSACVSLKEHQIPRVHQKEEFEGDSSNQSSFFSTGDTFEDKSLQDESNNLMIDNTEDDAAPKRLSEPHGDIEMREGMFKCVYVGGSVQKYLKIREQTYLFDGVFAWGWSMEKICLKSPTKIPKGNKRKLLRDSHSPSPKKLAVPTDRDKCVQSDSRESKSNSKTSSLTSIAVKNDIEPSCSSRQHKVSHLPVEKRAIPYKLTPIPSVNSKSSKCLPTEKRSPVKRLGYLEKQPKPVDSLRGRKEPASLVPSSDGNCKIPRSDCEVSSKCSKIIDDATMDFISSKKDKRTIYSGKKTVHDIPSLKVMSSDIIKKNILNMKFAKNVPFKVLKPFLEMFSASKLRLIEQQNEHVSKHTGYIWENLYKNEFRGQPHVAGQQWKEIYWRARVKRDNKLRSLTASISNGMAKAQPERQAKLMDVHASNPEVRAKKRVEEPPKIILNGRVSSYTSNGKNCGSDSSPKIILNGKVNGINGKMNGLDSSPIVSLDGRVSSSSSSGKSSGSESSSSPVSVQKPCKISKPPKKTVAPLMSKTKKMLNLVNRRR